MLAHIKNQDNQEKTQSLKQHSEETASYASECLKDTFFKEMAYCAGLLHDMGKAKTEFQDYLRMAYEGNDVKKGSVNHTFAAVIYLLDKWHKTQNKENILSEILSYAVGSHHGLFDFVDFEGKSGFEHRIKYDRDVIFYDETKRNFFNEVISEEGFKQLFDNAELELEYFIRKLNLGKEKTEYCFFVIAFLCKILASSVIYGDRKSTIEFEYENVPKNTILWDKEIDFFENEIKNFKRDNKLNIVRAEISDMCVKASERPTGIYKLNVPTGGGKTLSSFRYAIHHAEKYKKNRIIYVIPYLSIIDQNADVLRKYMYDENLILEHHSDFIHEKIIIAWNWMNMNFCVRHGIHR